MTDLINRTDLIAHLNQCFTERDANIPIVKAVLTAIKCAVEQMSIVDAEPVIRCKDCKKWDGSEAICDWWYCKTDSHFFCGYADKR